MISDPILFSFFSIYSTIIDIRINNIDKDFMYLFLFYRIFIYVSIRAAPRCIIYEPRCKKNARKDAGYFSHAPITIWFYLLLLLIFHFLSLHSQHHIRNISCLKSVGIILILLGFNYHLIIQISALTFFPPYFSYSPYAFCWLYITPRSAPLSSLSFPYFS